MIIQLFGLGIEGKSKAVTAQKRVNVYYEPATDKGKLIAYPMPGFTLFATPSFSKTRGIWFFESTGALFVVQYNRLYRINSDGTSVEVGQLDGDDVEGRVSMADNGTQMLVVTGVRGYIYNKDSQTLTKITDPQFPGGDTCCFLDSFFVVSRPGTGQFWLSDSYDGLAWSGLAWATAESNPDTLTAVVADRGGLVLFGSISTELWYNVGSIPVPFSRIEGAPAEKGLAARWSLAKCGGMWTGLFRDRQSSFSIGRLNGYQIEKISTPELDYLINKYSTPTDAVAFAYTMNGHEFYQITFQAEAVTWVYDSTTGLWSNIESRGITRSVLDLGAAFGAKVLATRYDNGEVYILDPDVYTENGAPVIREITGPHNYAADSLNLIRIHRLRVDMEGGIGLTAGQGALPTIMLQISRDGGHTWGNEMWTTFGSLGEYRQRAEWRRLGQGRDFVFKVRVSDPVKVVFINAFIEVEESRS